MPRIDLHAWLRARTRNPHVIARVLRLNPDPHPGTLLRGWRQGEPDRALFPSIISLAMLERRHGRVLRHDPEVRRCIIRYGRRHYLKRCSAIDLGLL